MDIPDYNSKDRYGPFFFIFSLSKILKTLGTFLSYDVLKILPLSLFLLISSIIVSVFLIILQKPFSSGPKLKLNQWLKISQYSICMCFIQVIVSYGLILCGPLRFILIFEHNEVVVLSVLSSIFMMSSSNTTKSRGTFIFLCAVVSILFFDHDHNDHLPASVSDDHFISTVFNYVMSLFGLSDHKAGVILLLLGLLLDTACKQIIGKKIQHAIGGQKRLTAFSAIISTVFWLIICAANYCSSQYHTFLHNSSHVHESLWHIGALLFFVAVTVNVIDFYVTSITVTKYGPQFVGFYANCIMGLTGLLLSVIWNHPYTTSKTVFHKIVVQSTDEGDHSLSAGVTISVFLMGYACHLLSSSYNRSKSNKGNIIGYSKAGLPMYTFSAGEEFLHRTGQSIASHIHKTLVEILSDDNSRRIFYYLVINLIFAFVELSYGFWTNSLALISDGFHMLFDSTAIVMGLYAAVVSRWKPSKIYSFGYHRVEALSGFINGLFLIVISLSVCCNGVDRLFHPPEVNTDRLMAVSIIGLLVNLFGMVALGHGHSHGGGQSEEHGNSHANNTNHEHAHSHSHSHSHGHSHGGSKHDSSNMRGVYLHVLADTLGSVGVIFSSFLMDRYGWYIADPLCSLFISVLIFRSVVPLLSQTISVLTLQAPTLAHGDDCSLILKEMLTVDGVVEARDPRIWQHTSGINCLSTRLFLETAANEQDVLEKIHHCMRHFKHFEFVTIQLEKESFEMHMCGLGSKLPAQVVFGRAAFDPQVVIHAV